MEMTQSLLESRYGYQVIYELRAAYFDVPATGNPDFDKVRIGLIFKRASQ